MPYGRRKTILKNRVAPEIEQQVVQMAFDQPAWGQVRVCNELRNGISHPLREKAVFISPGGVRSVWLRHDLHTFNLRLKALEAKVAREGIILTEGQIAALERAEDEKEAHGEIEKSILAIWGPRILSTLEPSKVSDAYISRPLLTRTQRWRLPSSMTVRMPLLLRTC